MKERPFYNRTWFGWMLVVCAALCPPLFMVTHHNTTEAWGGIYGFGMAVWCAATMVVLGIIGFNIIENDY
jgi:hypothetical protein